MQTLPIRLSPGQDLRSVIEAAVRGANCRAAFVLSGIGSLSSAGLRFAGAEQPRRLTGDMEILSPSGTVVFNGTGPGARSSSHLHMALSTATGEVFGGHVAPGCIVRTTAEVLLALLPEWSSRVRPMRRRGMTSWWCGRSASPVAHKSASTAQMLSLKLLNFRI